MAQPWFTFCHVEDYQPDMYVGPSDRYLMQLPFGPTQADRVLVHTPIMDVAHDRRFVICETEGSMSEFETEHCQRMEQAIDMLEEHIAKNPSDEQEDSITSSSKALIGLAPLPSETQFADTFPGPIQHQASTKLSLEETLRTLARPPPPIADVLVEDLIMVDDEKEEEASYDDTYARFNESMKNIRKRVSILSEHRARQRNPHRVRKVNTTPKYRWLTEAKHMSLQT